MLIPNLVKDVFLAVKVVGTWNLYARKNTGQLWLLGTFYDQFHAVKCRKMVALLYGLGHTYVSKEDCMRELPQLEATLLAKVHKLNLNSRNAVVRQHAELATEMLNAIRPWDPIEYAKQLLMKGNK